MGCIRDTATDSRHAHSSVNAPASWDRANLPRTWLRNARDLPRPIPLWRALTSRRLSALPLAHAEMAFADLPARSVRYLPVSRLTPHIPSAKYRRAARQMPLPTRASICIQFHAVLLATDRRRSLGTLLRVVSSFLWPRAFTHGPSSRAPIPSCPGPQCRSSRSSGTRSR